MRFERKQILITVKAYPNPSIKYGETVCCSGVDLNNLQLVRLYPISYRDLDSDKKFRKYSIIEVDCFPPSDDRRPESFRVNIDTIKVIDWLDTERGTWEKRKSIILRLPIKTMCQVIKDAEDNDLSLGFIKPMTISFEWAKHSLSDQKKRDACYAQLSFLDKQKNTIETSSLTYIF